MNMKRPAKPYNEEAALVERGEQNFVRRGVAPKEPVTVTSSSTAALSASSITVSVPLQRLDAGLYVVATPIGNLSDVTLRGLATLSSASAIYCEDTRVSAKLLARYGIKRRLATYHDHTDNKVRDEIIGKIKSGSSIALVSDAGTPLVADPGYRLVRLCRENGLSVFAVPGPSSVTASLSIAGAPTDRFTFFGFFPKQEKAGSLVLADVMSSRGTSLLFERASRLSNLLLQVADLDPKRRVTIAREVTKLHEETVCDIATVLAAQYASTVPKGEVVVLIHPPDKSENADNEVMARTMDMIRTRLHRLLSGGMRFGAAVDEVYDNLDRPSRSGLTRRIVYSEALAIRRDLQDDPG